MRRRWEEDGWLGTANGRLAVATAGSFAGDVGYKDRSPDGSQGAIYEIGIGLLPEHRGHGVGTFARLLVEYLIDTTPAHRLQACTELENIAEQRALEKVGFGREGVMRKDLFRAGEVARTASCTTCSSPATEASPAVVPLANLRLAPSQHWTSSLARPPRRRSIDDGS